MFPPRGYEPLLIAVVRWVNAIWSVLERTRADPTSSTAPSIRSRPMSLISSAGGGSSSTRYTSGHHQIQGQGLPSPGLAPFSSMHSPLYTTDDAVITTSAGMAAPLAHRGSRRLAVGGVERARSLRRVASEADLSEVTGDFNRSESDHVNPPLTVEAARRSLVSRDFTFAGGIAPPPIPSTSALASGYVSPESRTVAHTAPLWLSSGEAYTAGDSTPAQTARLFSPESDRTARFASHYGTSLSPGRATTLGTAASTIDVFGTAATSAASLYATPPTEPPFATASAGSRSTGPYEIVTSGTRPFGTPTGTVYDTVAQSVYSTALGPISFYGTAQQTVGQLSDPGRISQETISSYDTAPPPVPSHDSQYDNASLAPASAPNSRDASLVRYQLHDRPMSSVHDGSGGNVSVVSVTERSTWHTVPGAPTSPHTAQDTLAAPPTVYQTALDPTPYTSFGYQSSHDALSFQSDIQEQAETATHISEPNTDLGLLADLECQSSAGSAWVRPFGRRTGTEKSGYSGKTPFGTGIENTLYQTARDTIYSTVPSWQTQSAYAAPGTFRRV